MTTAEPLVRVRRDVLIAANQDAGAFYRDQLLHPANHGPRHYLTRRGFGALLDNTPWITGYAPAGWTRLVDYLAEQGYSDATLLDAGLALRTRRGTLIDRFRDRITFGIGNLDQELVGFTARCSPAADHVVPKYLNTPTTALYHKSEVLFGLGEHADRLRRGATLVLVEGPLDAIAVDLANSKAERMFAPVALCGTTLTNTHATQIAKLVIGHVIVALDEDDAGARAAENSYIRLARHLTDLSTPQSWKRNDPAEILQVSGPDGLREHLSHLSPLSQHVIDALLASWPNLHESIETELAGVREVARVFAQAQPLDMAAVAQHLLGQTALGDEVVTRELAAATSVKALARHPQRIVHSASLALNPKTQSRNR